MWIIHDERMDPDESAKLDGAAGFEILVTSRSLFSEIAPGDFLFEETASHGRLQREPDVIDLVTEVLRTVDRPDPWRPPTVR